MRTLKELIDEVNEDNLKPFIIEIDKENINECLIPLDLFTFNDPELKFDMLYKDIKLIAPEIVSEKECPNNVIEITFKSGNHLIEAAKKFKNLK